MPSVKQIVFERLRDFVGSHLLKQRTCFLLEV